MKKWIAVLIVAVALHAQERTQDKVVAVVGDEVILESDIRETMEFLKGQYQVGEEEAQALRDEILNELIKEKLLLHEAKQDTSIKVTDEEVDQAVENQIQEIRQSLGKDQFEAELKAEGLTLEEFKEKIRKQIRDQLYIQKLIEKRIKPKIVVTPAEVREFYEQNKDSIPSRPPMAQLAHILIRIKPSQKQIDEAKERANKIYQRLKNGEDFATLAMQYSDDPNTRDLGGDLGYIRLSEIQDPIASIIKNLEPGEISEPYYDELGFHIFRVDDRNGDLVRLRHILIAPIPTAQDSERARTLARGIYKRLKDGQPFEELAKRYSDDPTTRDKGGLVGYFPIPQLPSKIREVVDTLTVGTFSNPIETETGIYIIQVLDKKKGGKPTFEEVQQDLTLLLQQRKLQQEIDKLTERLRKKIYVEIKGG